MGLCSLEVRWGTQEESAAAGVSRNLRSSLSDCCHSTQMVRRVMRVGGEVGGRFRAGEIFRASCQSHAMVDRRSPGPSRRLFQMLHQTSLPLLRKSSEVRVGRNRDGSVYVSQWMSE